MRGLKDVGITEVNKIKRRTLRLLALGRVLPADALYITKRLDEVEAKIVQMREFNERGEDV
jgi:hypothetical protein